MATIEDINSMYLGLTGSPGDPQIIGYLSDAINNGRMTLGDVRALIAPQQAMPAGLLGPAPQQAPQINPEIANAFMQSLLYQSQLPGMNRMANPTAVNPLNIPPTPSPYRINWPSTSSAPVVSQPVDEYSGWNYYDNEGNPIPKPTTTKK